MRMRKLKHAWTGSTMNGGDNSNRLIIDFSGYNQPDKEVLNQEITTVTCILSNWRLTLEMEVQELIDRVTILEEGHEHMLEVQRSILQNQEQILSRLAALEKCDQASPFGGPAWYSHFLRCWSCWSCWRLLFQIGGQGQLYATTSYLSPHVRAPFRQLYIPV